MTAVTGPSSDVLFARLVEEFTRLEPVGDGPASQQAFRMLLQSVGYDENSTGPSDSEDASWFAFVQWVFQQKTSKSGPDARGADEANVVQPLTHQTSEEAPIDQVWSADPKGVGDRGVGDAVLKLAEASPVVEGGSPESAETTVASEEAGVAHGEAMTDSSDSDDDEDLLLYNCVNPFDLEVASRNSSLLDAHRSTLPSFRSTLRWSHHCEHKVSARARNTENSEFWQDVSAPSTTNRTSRLQLEHSSFRLRLLSEMSLDSRLD